MTAFSRPTRAALVARAIQDVEAELQNGGAMVRRTLERALATMQAGLSHTQHGHIEWSARQLFPDSADDDFLLRWAQIYLGEDARKEATRAAFTIEVAGTEANAPIPESTRWVRVDGRVFESTAPRSLPGSAPFEVEVPVRAVEAGASGNTIPGSTLTLESPVNDVEAAATVLGDPADGAIGGGADIERIEDLLVRLLNHLQDPPKAGSRGDYIRWALEVPGVTRAWELPLQLGPSTVLVLAVQDTFGADGFYEDTLFGAIDYEGVLQPYIDDRANVTAIVTAAAPVRVELNPDIDILPHTPELEDAVSAQLNDMLLRQTGPQNGGSVVFRWQLIQAIALTPGLQTFVLHEPSADVDLAANELLVLGTPNYDEVT